MLKRRSEIGLVDFTRPYFQDPETLDKTWYIRPAPNFGGISAGFYESETSIGGISESNPQTEVYQLAVMLRDVPAHNSWKDGKHVAMLGLRTGMVACVDMRHQWQIERSYPFKSMHLYVPQSTLDGFAKEMGSKSVVTLNIPRLGTKDNIIYYLAKVLEELMKAVSPPPSLLTDQILSSLRTHIACQYGAVSLYAIKRRSDLSKNQVTRLRSLMLDDLELDISLSDLCLVADMPAENLRRAFKREFGASPHRWRLERKTERARNMVECTGRTLSEIAALCGFADQSHFTRVFSKMYGIPPGAYRNRQRNQ